jgi:hypothetical protein
MLKYAFAAIISVMVANPSDAATFRLSVTGNSGGFLVADRVTDLEGNDVAGPSDVDFSLISEDQIPGSVVEFLRSSTGFALFKPSGLVTDCIGLLTFLCGSRAGSGSYWVETFEFDQLLNTFDFRFRASAGGVEADSGGLWYGDDEGFTVTVGVFVYLFVGGGGPILMADFTRVEISKVPGPASAFLLIPAVGLLALARRRRNRTMLT